MKGFSGFGNSPMKKKIWPPTKGEFNIDYDEIDKEGKPTYNDPTDPKSPNYNPKHGGHDFVKPKLKSVKDAPKRKIKETLVDPDAPGTPGKPGYEPPVDIKSIDAASYIKGKMLRNKKKK